jgi:hypothetical protein
LFYEHFIDIDDWNKDQISTKYHYVIGIVDCTELAINTWQTNSFSKKKGGPTLKYQGDKVYIHLLLSTTLAVQALLLLLIQFH